jgi:hypothetical protein
MAKVELAITFVVEDTDAERMRKAFARRFRKPSLTLGEMLAGLKANAMTQVNSVVLAEERDAIEETKAAIQPIAIE